jgi:hypothetical protein
MKTVTLILLLAFWQPLFSQIKVNRVWETSTGTPVNFMWHATTTDAYNNIIIVGNTATTNAGANILVIKQSSDGDIEWQRTFNHSHNKDDYGIAVVTDPTTNDIFIAAAVTDTVNGYNYAILKYSTTGALSWSTIFNGDGNKDDIPVAISLDGDGNIIVTGFTESLNNENNFLTLKLDENGDIVWSEEKDIFGFDDVAIKLEINHPDQIVIVGASEVSNGLFRVVTLVYDENGIITDSLISSNTIAGGSTKT